MSTRAINGAAVRELREALGITQRDLAARAKLTQGGLSNIETGKSGAYPRTARNLADALGVSLDSIYPVQVPA